MAHSCLLRGSPRSSPQGPKHRAACVWSWQGSWLPPEKREPRGIHNVSYDPVSDVTSCHFCCILFIRSVSKPSPHSRVGELGSTSWRKECQGTCGPVLKPPAEGRILRAALWNVLWKLYCTGWIWVCHIYNSLLACVVQKITVTKVMIAYIERVLAVASTVHTFPHWILTTRLCGRHSDLHYTMGLRGGEWLA